jgi:hypothetical protein
MAMSADANARQARLKAWYEGLGSRDPELRAELEARSGELTETEVETRAPGGMALEAMGSFRPAASEMSLETIVRTGRPALFVMNDAIQTDTPLNDPVSRVMVERVVAAKSVLDPWMPLIGRIDVLNHPAGLPFVGTGWLIQPGIVCTNRHVANLLGRQDGARYVFSRGRFDRPMTVTLNRRGEKDRAQAQPGDASPILEILWIEPDSGPDVALLRVGPPANGLTPTHLTLSGDDGREGQFITTIGYPARAYADTIPNQTWMDTIYGGVYDIKRAAPGELFAPKDGSSTYDCTTLGGASGSPVLDPATGKVLALHFAGLYEVENYGVPASRLRKYIGPIPSITTGGEAPSGGPPSGGSPVPPATPPGVGVVLGVGHRTATVTIPITITVGIGEAVSARPASLDEAIAQLAAERRPGVLAVKPGYSLVDGRDVIVVAADPRDFDAVRAATPAVHAGHPVEVRYATIEEQLGLTAGFEVAEAAATIVYDDGLRSGPDFSFDPIDEEMTVLAHVGPEQSFPVLKAFLAGARTSLVSSMYQFFAGHVADSVEARLKAGVTMRIVLDPLTRDPKVGEVKAGEFDRGETFKRWRDDHAFDNIYVRKGSGGLIDTSYHIKVTVRDGDAFWLSSGNWTRSSQPFPDPVTGRASGNREWHVVVENKTLSTVFASHIQADYAQCQALGATPEAPAEDAILVDVPDAFLPVESEAPPRTLSPLRVEGRVKVKPILTPDRRGRVYTDAVLALIRSAKHQLVFQNQYIKILKGTGGNLGELVDALVERSRAIEDVRVILRDGEVIDNVTELKRRGMDVTRCVRIIGNTHTKGIVVDGKRVLVGSQNWSGQALSTNRDASLLFDDARIAEYFLEAFEIDWARARTPSLVKPSKPVLRAEGAEPPPGYSRMTLAEYLER